MLLLTKKIERNEGHNNDTQIELPKCLLLHDWMSERPSELYTRCSWKGISLKMAIYLEYKMIILPFLYSILDKKTD